MMRQLRNAPALFTQEDLYELEASIKEDKDGVTRRIALAVLTQSGAEFLQAVADNREFAVEIAKESDCLTHYVKRLRMLTEWMDTAQVRMVLALAKRRDMDSVLDEAKPTQDVQPA